MTDGAGGEIERFFDRLTAYDWEAFGALLTTDVERIGFLGDVVVGREAYVELMSAGSPSATDEARQPTTWDVHHIAYAPGGRTGFARITARVPRAEGEMRIEQALAFEIEEDGLISAIEAFWRTTEM